MDFCDGLIVRDGGIIFATIFKLACLNACHTGTSVMSQCIQYIKCYTFEFSQ